MNKMIKKTVIPKSMVAFLVIMQLIFGIDLGFIKHLKNERFQTAAKYISVFISLMVMLILLLCSFHNELTLTWIVAYLLQYILAFLILKLSKYNFYDFVMNISHINNDIPDFKNESLGIITLAYSGVVFFSKLSFALTYSLLGIEIHWNATLIPYYAYITCCVGIDMMSVIFILIYYYMYYCVKHLKLWTMASPMKIKQMQKLYYDIAISYKKVISIYDNLIVVELVFEVPKLMSCAYYILLFVKYNEDKMFLYVDEMLYIVHILIRIIVPSIVTEMVKYQVEAIKLALHDQLLVEESENQRFEIQRMLRYMEARRLEHKVWRVIPIDLQLPLTVLSMCVTYLIVIIQFTHLYD